jgi:peptide/nickel transport system permease protein
MNNSIDRPGDYAFWSGGIITSIVILLTLFGYYHILMDYLEIKNLRLIEYPRSIPMPWCGSPEFSRVSLPSKEHILGLDIFGRDMFSMAVYGMAALLPTLLLAAVIALVGGIALGTSATYFNEELEIKGRKISAVEGIADIISKVMTSFPQIPTIILIWSFFEKVSIYYVMAIFGVFNIPGVAEKVKTKIKYLKKEGFVESSRALGVSRYHILFRHMLYYQMRGILIIEVTFIMGDAILFESIVSFLGFSTNSFTAGNIIAQAKDCCFITMRDITCLNLMKGLFLDGRLWSCFTCPGLLIFFPILGFYLLGDGLKRRLIKNG